MTEAGLRRKLAYMPNQKKHRTISFIKSGIRITAGVVALFIPIPLVKISAVVFIIAELVGVYEEMV